MRVAVLQRAPDTQRHVRAVSGRIVLAGCRCPRGWRADERSSHRMDGLAGWGSPTPATVQADTSDNRTRSESCVTTCPAT